MLKDKLFCKQKNALQSITWGNSTLYKLLRNRIPKSWTLDMYMNTNRFRLDSSGKTLHKILQCLCGNLYPFSQEY